MEEDNYEIEDIDISLRVIILGNGGVSINI